MKCKRLGGLLTIASALLIVAPFGCDSNPDAPKVGTAPAEGTTGGATKAPTEVVKVGVGRSSRPATPGNAPTKSANNTSP